MITDSEHQKADIWLAEQTGEHVHEWKKCEQIDAGHRYACSKPDCSRSFLGCSSESLHAPRATPRSKDLGAMVNVVDKLGCYITRFEMQFKVIVTIQPSEIDKMSQERTEILEIKDHESPQHAAAWAILEALRKVKK